MTKRLANPTSRSEVGKIGAKALHAKYNFSKENNPNWKNGISKNHYHYKKIQVARYPDRCEARRKCYRAVKAGKIMRFKCEKCGDKNSFAHHADYSKPFEVRWFCRKHHREIHENKH